MNFNIANFLIVQDYMKITGLISSFASGLPGRLVPELLIPEKINQYRTVMRKEYAWHLAGALQPQEAVQWVLVYHSSAHGLSFNTFLSKLAYVFLLQCTFR